MLTLPLRPNYSVIKDQDPRDSYVLDLIFPHKTTPPSRTVITVEKPELRDKEEKDE